MKSLPILFFSLFFAFICTFLPHFVQLQSIQKHVHRRYQSIWIVYPYPCPVCTNLYAISFIWTFVRNMAMCSWKWMCVLYKTIHYSRRKADVFLCFALLVSPQSRLFFGTHFCHKLINSISTQYVHNKFHQFVYDLSWNSRVILCHLCPVLGDFFVIFLLRAVSFSLQLSHKWMVWWEAFVCIAYRWSFTTSLLNDWTNKQTQKKNGRMWCTNTYSLQA